MADGSGFRAAQMSRLLARRDAMMSENLQAIATREARRGPTLVFANNSLLQKDRSRFLLPARWGGGTVSWWGAGAIAGARIGDRYAFLASALGSAPDRGLGVPNPDTLEGALYAPRGRPLHLRLEAPGRGPSRQEPEVDTADRGVDGPRLLPLDPDRLDGTDGIVFVKDISPPPIGGSSPT